MAKRTTVTYDFFCDLTDGGGTPAVVTDFYIAIGGRGYLVDMGEDALKGVTELMSAVRRRGRPCDEMPGNPRGRPVPGGSTEAVVTGTGERAANMAHKAHGKRVRKWVRENIDPTQKSTGVIKVPGVEAYNEAHPDDIYTPRTKGRGDVNAKP
jgi:hypothetical protein